MHDSGPQHQKEIHCCCYPWVPYVNLSKLSPETGLKTCEKGYLPSLHTLWLRYFHWRLATVRLALLLLNLLQMPIRLLDTYVQLVRTFRAEMRLPCPRQRLLASCQCANQATSPPIRFTFRSDSLSSTHNF